MRAVLGLVLAVVSASATGCRTQPWVLDGFQQRDLSGGDLGIDLGIDLAMPIDLTIPIDLSLADLTRPHYCNGIYVFDEDNRLSFFDPVQLVFHDIAQLACPGGASPFSMALGRDGTAWVEYDSGNLFRVDSDTGACSATSFVPGQQGISTFGMGFASDSAGGTTETLFIAANGNSTSPELGSIALQSLTVTLRASLPGSAELTGTGEGELWGFFGEAQAHAGRIDKTSGVVSPDFQLPQLGDVTQDGYAFGYFGGSFYVFLLPQAGYTTVYRLDPSDGSLTTVLSDMSRHIVGAGVSTCAPTM